MRLFPEELHHPFEAKPVPLEFLARQTLGLSERFGVLHSHLRRAVPAIDRMAVALYDHDPGMAQLKTFVSTVGGEPLRSYQYNLSDSPSLLRLKVEGKPRIIDDIGKTLTADTEHTR